MSLNHLDETIKRSLSRSYSSNCILPIFSLDPCSLVFTSYCHILQSVFCLFFPRSLCPGVYLIPQFSQAICLPECWGGGESTQEAPKWSSKGVRCLFFGHATAPFSSKTPALNCSPARAKMGPKWPWFANPSLPSNISPSRGQSAELVPWIDFQSVIISLFPVLTSHFTSSPPFRILPTAPLIPI